MKNYLLSLLLVSSLLAGTYDDPYSGLEQKSANDTKVLDKFMYGNFVEIKRFEMLDFSKFNDFTNRARMNSIIWRSNIKLNDDFEAINTTIQKYISDDKNILIKVIGHASEKTDDFNEVAIDSTTYANGIQNCFRNSQDTNETIENSKSFAKHVATKLVDNNVSKDIIVVEHRGSEELAYSAETDDGRDLSNRVMVTMYVLSTAKKDTDKDGVFDSKDECPNTPLGVVVDEKGCPFDTDQDGVLDYKDDCPETPLGVAVDEFGCPFDTDGDGVVDHKDECPATPEGLTVNKVGCPVGTTLRLNFNTASAEILEASNYLVEKFSNFLKDNETYQVKIIGHTDSVGSNEYNMDLSMRRAASLKEALVKDGIEEKRLEASGEGELNPLETNDTPEGRAVNRRLEVELYY